MSLSVGGVQTDPDRHGLAGRTAELHETPADVDCGRGRALGVGKGSERAIALVLDHHTTGAGDGSVDQPVVLAQQAGPGIVPQVLGQPGGSLDVAEQERHLARRKRNVPGLWHGRMGTPVAAWTPRWRRARHAARSA